MHSHSIVHARGDINKLVKKSTELICGEGTMERRKTLRVAQNGDSIGRLLFHALLARARKRGREGVDGSGG